MAVNDRKIYTVSELATLIKVALEQSLPSRLIVVGQLSGFKQHSSGHCYFDLKDENAIMPCVMWRSDFAKLKFKPQNGLAVIVKGNIDVYLPHGKYQFYAEAMEPAGIGSLQIAFEQMVKKLQAEGLFEDEHKKPIPKYPMRIGILTSESGAAVHDIADSIWSRWPIAKLFLFDVPVQGEGAAQEISKMLRTVNRRNKELGLDIVIVGRGGGSMEDLWAFNEEVLARAIYASKIPVISAVGHERDTTIADLVADARASTPTKAGVIAVPDINEVMAGIDNISKRLKADIVQKLALARQSIATIQASAVFRNPKFVVMLSAQRLDGIEIRLVDILRDAFFTAKDRLNTFQSGISRIEPARLVAQKRAFLIESAARLNSVFNANLSRAVVQLTAVENRISAMNPRAVLQRGYSLTTVKRTGNILTDVKNVLVGDDIITELAGRKTVESRVTKVDNM